MGGEERDRERVSFPIMVWKRIRDEVERISVEENKAMSRVAESAFLAYVVDPCSVLVLPEDASRQLWNLSVAASVRDDIVKLAASRNNSPAREAEKALQRYINVRREES